MLDDREQQRRARINRGSDSFPDHVNSVDSSVQENSELSCVKQKNNQSQQGIIPDAPPLSATSGKFRSKGIRILHLVEGNFPRSYFELSDEIRYIPWTYSVPSGDGQSHLLVVFLKSAMDSIFAHAIQDKRNERFGILVGGAFFDPKLGQNWVEVVEMLPAKQVNANIASVEVSHEELARLNQKVDSLLSQTQDKIRKLGWYHTHPGHGIFMSGTDQINQNLSYTADWQIALVVDPVQMQFGLFSGSGCVPVRHEAFFIVSEDDALKAASPAYFAWQTASTIVNKIKVPQAQFNDQLVKGEVLQQKGTSQEPFPIQQYQEEDEETQDT